MGGGTNSLGMGLELGAGLMEAANLVGEGKGKAAQYDAQARGVRDQARLNERMAERQVAYDTAEKNSRIEMLREETDRTLGGQITTMAASGMSLMSQTAMNLVSDSLRSGSRDVGNVSQAYADRAYETRLQARLSSIDAEAQAKQMKIAGSSARRAGRIAAFGSLLGTAAQVASQYGQPKTAKESSVDVNKRDLSKDPLAKKTQAYGKKFTPWNSFGGIK